MNNSLCIELLQRAYKAEQCRQDFTDTSGLAPCGKELAYLVKIGYVQVVHQEANGTAFRITPKGHDFKELNKE